MLMADVKDDFEIRILDAASLKIYCLIIGHGIAENCLRNRSRQELRQLLVGSSVRNTLWVKIGVENI